MRLVGRSFGGIYSNACAGDPAAPNANRERAAGLLLGFPVEERAGLVDDDAREQQQPDQVRDRHRAVHHVAERPHDLEPRDLAEL